MPEFTKPFSGMVPPRKLTDSELARALRLDLAAEEEAVHIYEAHADATDNPLAKKVLKDVADEERVHAGEFQRLINILLKDEEQLLNEGAEEVNEMVGELKNQSSQKDEQQSQQSEKPIPTVGDLKSF